MSVIVFSAGCVLPNEPLDSAAPPNLAPRIELGTADPVAGVTQVDISCDTVSVQVETRDPDDASLLYRWVVRDEDDTRWITDNASNGEPNSPRVAQKTVTATPHFNDQRDPESIDNPIANHTAVVILYVTDAPTYAISNPDIRGQGQKTGPGDNDSRDYPADFNLGAIPSPDMLGGQQFSVTSYTWAFEFNRRGPPCP